MAKEMTVNEAAEALNLSPWTVRNLCWRGELPARRTRYRWIIPAEAILAMKEQKGVPNAAMIEWEKEHERAK